MSPVQRGHIKRLGAGVRGDPTPDEVWKISLPYLGAMYVKAVDDDGYWLLYFEQNQTVYCVSCGKDSPYIDVLADLI